MIGVTIQRQDVRTQRAQRVNMVHCAFASPCLTLLKGEA